MTILRVLMGLTSLPAAVVIIACAIAAQPVQADSAGTLTSIAASRSDSDHSSHRNTSDQFEVELVLDLLYRAHVRSGHYLVRPTITIFPAHVPLAFSHPSNQIKISTGMLKLASNRSSLAFVVAHELSHLINANADPYAWESQSLTGDALLQELAADTHALQIMGDAGFDSNFASDVMERLVQYEPMIGITFATLFPGLRPRVAALQGVREARCYGVTY